MQKNLLKSIMKNPAFLNQCEKVNLSRAKVDETAFFPH